MIVETLVQRGLNNAIVSADWRLPTANVCGSRQSPVGSHKPWRYFSRSVLVHSGLRISPVSHPTRRRKDRSLFASSSLRFLSALLRSPTLSGLFRIRPAEFPRYRRGRHTATLNATPTAAPLLDADLSNGSGGARCRVECIRSWTCCHGCYALYI